MVVSIVVHHVLKKCLFRKGKALVEWFKAEQKLLKAIVEEQEKEMGSDGSENNKSLDELQKEKEKLRQHTCSVSEKPHTFFVPHALEFLVEESNKGTKSDADIRKLVEEIYALAGTEIITVESPSEKKTKSAPPSCPPPATAMASSSSRLTLEPTASLLPQVFRKGYKYIFEPPEADEYWVNYKP